MEALCHEDLHLNARTHKGPISYGFVMIIESSASELIDFVKGFGRGWEELKLRVPKLEFQMRFVQYLSLPLMLTETDDFEVLGPWSTVQVYRSCDCHFYYPRATVREQGYAYNQVKGWWDILIGVPTWILSVSRLSLVTWELNRLRVKQVLNDAVEI